MKDFNSFVTTTDRFFVKISTWILICWLLIRSFWSVQALKKAELLQKKVDAVSLKLSGVIRQSE